MHTLVMYDIPSTRIRLKVIEACLDYGLDRMQYSVFEGSLSARQQESLMARLRDLMEKQAGSIVLVPISSDDWDRRMEIGAHPRQSDSAPPTKTESTNEDYPF